MKNALVIMLKNPILGKVKTRLAKDVGDDAALKIYTYLLQHTAKITALVNADCFVFYSDTIDRQDNFESSQFRKYVQCSGDLGTRMEYSFSIPYKDDFKKVVMIGSDCFELTTAIINEAFEQLDAHDFVIGPAHDGGYYLLGMKKWTRSIFRNKSWSTNLVFEETKNEILANNAHLFQLQTLHDIDTIHDVNRFEALNSLIKI